MDLSNAVPFKLWDTIYLIVRKRPKVSSDNWFRFIKVTIVTPNNFYRCYEKWGDEVFATKEEAERRIAELED
ncbi:MAG: hypothetical protein IKV50_09145 [Clostridia bacterium]|nr:hypothetical protein [Clostridia bacterium]